MPLMVGCSALIFSAAAVASSIRCLTVFCSISFLWLSCRDKFFCVPLNGELDRVLDPIEVVWAIVHDDFVLRDRGHDFFPYLVFCFFKRRSMTDISAVAILRRITNNFRVVVSSLVSGIVFVSA